LILGCTAPVIIRSIFDYIFDGEYILLGEDGTVRTSEGYPVLQYATRKFWVFQYSYLPILLEILEILKISNLFD
jgi:hypothetical protein